MSLFKSNFGWKGLLTFALMLQGSSWDGVYHPWVLLGQQLAAPAPLGSRKWAPHLSQGHQLWWGPCVVKAISLGWRPYP